MRCFNCLENKEVLTKSVAYAKEGLSIVEGCDCAEKASFVFATPKQNNFFIRAFIHKKFKETLLDFQVHEYKECKEFKDHYCFKEHICPP